MLDKPLKDIQISDLKELIADKVQEGKTIDYKRDMYLLDHDKPEVKDKYREEFLKDLSSFANTAGGHLIIGMDESNGMPTAIPGITIENTDNEKNRLHQLADKWIEPRLAFDIEAIPKYDEPKKHVFIIRVPQSLISPHRVVYQGKFGPFWARNSAGSYQMDTSELRQAFTLSEMIFDKIKRFHKERVEKVNDEDAPTYMTGNSNIFIHLIPLESFSSHLSFDIKYIMDVTKEVHISDFYFQTKRPNLDGFLCSGRFIQPFSGSNYIQLFRDGLIEYAISGITVTGNSGVYLRLRPIKEMIYENLRPLLLYLRNLGIHAPIWLFVTLCKVKGVGIAPNKYMELINENHLIDRDYLTIPEVRIDDLSSAMDAIFEPIYEIIWNAAGWDKAQY